MKPIFLLLACLCLGLTASANCTNAYASASYSLSHTKKSLSSNNFDHQKYYAGRALEAFEKTKALVEQCGCESSLNQILDGIENLENAIDPKDWEMGRYFTKKAMGNAQELLNALDVCSSGSSREQESHEGNEMGNAESTRPIETLKNPEELEAQLQLKRVAELGLLEYGNALRELAGILGCEEARKLLYAPLHKTEQLLEEESLEQTREYYRSHSLALQERALEALKTCAQIP